MAHGFSSKILILCMVFMVSCGARVNSSGDMKVLHQDISFLQIDKQCATSATTLEPVTVEIEKTYVSLQKRFQTAFYFIPLRSYDYKTPLIINLDDLSDSLKTIKERIADEEYLAVNLSTVAADIFHLYQNSMRFEGQKCAIDELMTKKNKDIRPFMEMKDFCTEKNQDGVCSKDTISKLSPKESIFVEERTVKICKAFDSSNVNCQAQFTIQRQKRDLSTLISYYQKRFETERFQTLFKLRESHLKFQCQKNELVTNMTVKVFSPDINVEELKILTSFVSTSWSRGNFKLTIELVEEKGSDVVEILPITNGLVSYVPDQDNQKVYLSRLNDLNTQKVVLAHEFGHVLGFPDCYIEYFDNQNKDLVYYEMGSENSNIMCSIKSGVSVPDDYFTQLTQNSCVFN